MKQAAPPPCPGWYADNEWNVSLWGTYAFTNTDYARNLDLVDVVQSTTEGGAVLGGYSKTELLGQFGVGLETRIARNIGWINDLSFGVIEGPRNNFGMVRTGINFAF